MSVYSGPNVMRSNLIAEWDAKNIKSYSNNRLTIQGQSREGIYGNNIVTTFPVAWTSNLTRVGYNQVIGGYTIKESDIVYSHDLSQGGCFYSGNTDFIPSGTSVTVTFDYFITEDADNWGRYATGLFALENYGGGALYGLINAPNSLKGTWQTVTQTFGPTSSNGIQAMFIYPAICSGVKQADRGLLYYRNPRVVFSNTVPQNFDGTSSSLIWYDTSGNNYHMTKTNNAGYGGPVVHRSPGYFDFTVNTPASTTTAFGGNGFSQSTSPIIPRTGSFTITAHGRRNPATKALGDRETVFSNAGSSNGWRFSPFGTSGGYYLLGASTSFYQETGIGSANTADGNWHAVTMVFDRNAILGSATVYFYVDGVLNGTSTISSGVTYANVLMDIEYPGIGYQGCCDVFAGDLSYVSVYDTALNATNVATLHGALMGRNGV